MKAWVVREQGAPWDVYLREDFPAPSHEAMAAYCLDLEGLRPIAEGEAPVSEYVFIQVIAAGLAWPDVTMATGEYPVPLQRPFICGQEAVGTVIDSTPGLRHLMGKRVMGFTPQPFGAFAEISVLTPPALFEVPDYVTDEQAAALVIASHTAYHAVHRRGQVQSGETVLILGAAGGVPSSALQLCVAAGARVIALAGGEEKCAFCRELGADSVIDYVAEDFVAAVTREIGPSAVDMIVDFVQGEAGARARPLLRVEGRHVMAGHAGGLQPVHPHEFYMQNWSLVGACMGYGYTPEQQEAMEGRAHAHVLDLMQAGHYRTPVSRVIDFEAIPRTLRDFTDRNIIGRVVARIGK